MEKKDAAHWTRCLDESGVSKFSDLISFLQQRHSFDYKTAHSFVHLYLEEKEKNSPRVLYSQQGRGGKVIYESPGIYFQLDWEFGGGDAVAIIYIPTEQDWKAQTATPLSERQKILDFIGQQVVKDQTMGKGSYVIYSNSMSIIG